MRAFLDGLQLISTYLLPTSRVCDSDEVLNAFMSMNRAYWTLPLDLITHLSARIGGLTGRVLGLDQTQTGEKEEHNKQCVQYNFPHIKGTLWVEFHTRTCGCSNIRYSLYIVIHVEKSRASIARINFDIESLDVSYFVFDCTLFTSTCGLHHCSLMSPFHTRTYPSLLTLRFLNFLRRFEYQSLYL